MSLFSSRIGLAELAHLARRLATSLESGIEMRRVWAREAGGRGRWSFRRKMRLISEQVDRGVSVTDALELTEGYFPPMFTELVAIGEQSGQLTEVLRHLAEHYEHRLSLRRAFLAGITWPVIELSAAVGFIGLVIWVMGLLGQMTGQPIDILGLGLVGTRGLLIYAAGVLAVVASLALLYQALQRGLLWVRPLQWLLMHLPVVGRVLETLAMARLSWALQLAGNTELSLVRSLPLCLRATHNSHYTQHIEAIVAQVRRGDELSLALANTGVFPAEFLEALDVGERSGRIPETMALLADQYQDRARQALATLTTVAGFAVWALVAAIIVLMIFRVFGFYVGMINEAANWHR